MKWKPRPYQLRAAKHLLECGGGALFADPGTGKTAASLAVISALKQAGKGHRTLIIAPLRVTYEVWPAEISKWDNFQDLSIDVAHGPSRDVALRGNADIVVTNPDNLKWLVPALKDHKFDNLIIDESTKFSNHGSARFKLLRSVLTTFRRRWILTGSPVSNSLMLLWAQIFICDLGARLTPYITHFRRKYFLESRHVNYSEWFPLPDTEQRLFEAIRDIALRLDAADCLDLPDMLSNALPVSLPKKAWDAYQELEDLMITQLDNDTLTAANAAVVVNKLQQIANGRVYLPDGSTELLHTEKDTALTDLVEELSGNPVLVAVSYLSEAQHLSSLFKGAPYLGGGVSPSRSKQIIADWNAGKLPVLLAHPASAGHGLNLQDGGHTVCWYGLTWSLELYEQFNRRLHRQGQGKPVTVHHVIARGTVDERILKSLEGKERTQRKLLNMLKSTYNMRK